MSSFKHLMVAGIVSLLLFAAVLPSLTLVIPLAVAQTNSTNTTTTASERMDLNATAITLSDQPIAVGHYSTISENMADNQTIQISVEGNTTITLPNSTETITTTDVGNVTITFSGTGGVLNAELWLTTEDGSENATVIVTEFFKDELSPGKGIASFSTNSTGKLAPLDGVIAVTLDEAQQDGTALVTFFDWLAGPLVDNNDPSSALTNTTETGPVTPSINGTTTE